MKEYVYKTRTKDLCVSINPCFSLDKSFPELSCYVWEYTIVLKNRGDTPLSILKSNWHIIDLLGRDICIQNDMIVRDKVFLNPNEEYEYTVSAPLSVPMGMMQGWYDLKDFDGNEFKVDAPTVSLDSPFHDLLMH